jgi:hypothetical protein
MLLSLHPGSLCPALTGIAAVPEHVSSNSLTISYTMTGRIADIAVPPLRAAARSKDLWQRTCFEAFVRPSDGLAYYEFNFSPSYEWAAYRFAKYRVGMSDADGIGPVKIDARSDRDSYTLRASLLFDGSFELARARSWQLGLSAVIEETSGRKSYWALAHPSNQPDFHHPDCFIHPLLPTLQP